MKCERCQSGTLVARKIPRFSRALVFTGAALLLLSVGAGGLGAAIDLFGFRSGATTSGAAMAPGLVVVLKGLIAGGALLVAVPAVIVGLVLLQRRSVWRCEACGHVPERAPRVGRSADTEK